MTEFVTPSEVALSSSDSNQFKRQHNLAWDTVPLGMSFIAKPDEIKIDVLRSLASRYGMKLGRFFKVINHGDKYEVFYKRNRTENEIISVGRPKAEKPKKEPAKAKFFTDEPAKKYGVLVAEPNHETGIGRAGCWQCGQVKEFNAYETPYDPETSRFTLTCGFEQCKIEFEVADTLPKETQNEQ